MMKEEFETLIGYPVSSEVYEKVEQVYMAFDSLFPDKQSVVRYWNQYDLNGFEKLYRDAQRFIEVQKAFDFLYRKCSTLESQNMILISSNSKLQNRLNTMKEVILEVSAIAEEI